MPTKNGMQLSSLSALMDEIDDFCGTKPPRRFPPKKVPGLRDAMLSAVIVNLATEISDKKLGGQIQGLAEKAYGNAGQAISG